VNLQLAKLSFPILLEGAYYTLFITAASVLFGTLIGLFVGIIRSAKIPVLNQLAAIYVDIIRGTPLLVQILITYFGLNSLESGMISPPLAAILACSVNSGAYVAEIFRAGIQSIEKGQMEAARSLGMGYVQALIYIILPQAFRRVVPPLGNEFIAMLKDTSLLSAIGIEELTRKGQLIVARTYDAFTLYIEVALFYLVLTFVISRILNVIERRLKVSDSH